MLVSHSANIFSQKGNSIVLMHNGNQLMCDAHTVREQHKGTAAFFLYYLLSSWLSFSFLTFVTLTVLFLSWGALIACFNNLTRAADLVL